MKILQYKITITSGHSENRIAYLKKEFVMSQNHSNNTFLDF